MPITALGSKYRDSRPFTGCFWTSAWLISGCSTGIGRQIALKALAKGHRVAVTARNPAAVEDIVAEYPEQSIALALDVTQREQVEHAVSETESAFGAIDVLVNNAGYGILNSFTQTTWEEQAKSLQVMATSVAQLCHQFLPGMLERGYGRIINVASLAAYTPEVPGNLYGAVKIFVVRMTRALALELVGMTAAVVGVHASQVHFIQAVEIRRDLDAPFPVALGVLPVVPAYGVGTEQGVLRGRMLEDRVADVFVLRHVLQVGLSEVARVVAPLAKHAHERVRAPVEGDPVVAGPVE